MCYHIATKYRYDKGKILQNIVKLIKNLLTTLVVQTIIILDCSYKERGFKLKKGTKLTDNPRNIRLGIRLTQEEANDIQYCADKLKTNRTDIINRGVKKIKEEIDKK